MASSRRELGNLKKQVRKNRKILDQGGKAKGPFKAYMQNDPFRPWYKAGMRYTQTVAFTAGAVGVFGSEQIFRLNSLFDPDYSGVGHQPYGMAEMTNLYRSYKVNGVKMEFEIYDPSADGCIIGMTVQPPGGAATITGKTVDTIKEQPMSLTRNISDSGPQRVGVKQYFPMHSLIGVSPIQFKANLDRYSAVCTANPTDSPLLRVAIANKQTAGATVYVRVSFTYYSQFYDRKTKAQS